MASIWQFPGFCLLFLFFLSIVDGRAAGIDDPANAATVAATTDRYQAPLKLAALLQKKEAYSRLFEVSTELLEDKDAGLESQASIMPYHLQAILNLPQYALTAEVEQRALALADKTSDRLLCEKILHALGKLKYRQEHLEDALGYFKQALTCAPVREHEIRAVLLMNIGSVQVQLGRYALAVENLLKAEALNEAAGLPADYALYRNMAGLFFYLEEWNKSIEYSRKALTLIDENHSSYASILTNLGLAYRKIGDLRKAYEMHHAALAKKPEYSIAWLNLSGVLIAMERYDEALSAAQKAYALFEKEGSSSGMATALRNQGKVFSKLGNASGAVKLYREALAIYDRQDEPPQRLELYADLEKVLASMGRYREALEIAKKYAALHDELMDAESAARIAELENAAELRRKEKELLLMQQQKESTRQEMLRLEQESRYQRVLKWFLIGALIAAVVMVALLIGVLHLRRRLHQELASQHADMKELNRQLHEKSMVDPLTGLYNRHYLTEVLAGFKTDGKVRNMEPMLVIMMDLDHFKAINDNYGHAYGDAVLQYFARLLRTCSRDKDIAVRWGGEEFMLLCEGIGMEQGGELCDRLRDILHTETFSHEGREISLSCSFGMAPFPLHLELPADWKWSVQLADAALYAAKMNGRDCWVGYSLKRVPHWLRDGSLNLERLRAENLLQVLKKS